MTNLQTNQETELFKSFNIASTAAAKFIKNSSQRHKPQDDMPTSDSETEDNPAFVDALLDIGEETGLLAETKDIRDELGMISMVLKHQVGILEDLAGALFMEWKGNHHQDKQAEIRRRFKEQQKTIETNLRDLERMDKQCEGIYTSVRPQSPASETWQD